MYKIELNKGRFFEIEALVFHDEKRHLIKTVHPNGILPEGDWLVAFKVGKEIPPSQNKGCNK